MCLVFRCAIDGVVPVLCILKACAILVLAGQAGLLEPGVCGLPITVAKCHEVFGNSRLEYRDSKDLPEAGCAEVAHDVVDSEAARTAVKDRREADGREV